MKILTVAYITSPQALQIANKTWESIPKEVELVVVKNKAPRGVYSERVIGSVWIENDVNCLARAWNKGLKEIFKTEDYAFVSGLDSMCPQLDQLEDMVETLKQHPEYGMVSATPLNSGYGEAPIKHGDGSFSFYCISKECFKKVGKFDERYTPAYFEDNDYLERLWLAGYKPQRLGIYYYHIGQGTLKTSEETQKTYASFMNKNLKIFKDTYGKVPEHLPKDIVFK